jgi:hypothetical protein
MHNALTYNCGEELSVPLWSNLRVFLFRQTGAEREQILGNQPYYQIEKSEVAM